MEVIFNMHKVKYVDMDRMVNNKPGDVQVFINLESLFRKLISANVEDYLKNSIDTRVYEFISNVLNLAAHYRKFYTNKKIKSEIILYINNPDSTFTNSKHIPEYRIDTATIYRETTVFGKFIREAFPLIKIFTDYIEGIYFIVSDKIEPSMIPAIMDNGSPNKVIVTTDKYEYQYVNHGFDIIRPKSKGNSYSLNAKNAIEVMKQESRTSNQTTMSSNFIPLILSFGGDVRRSIPKIKGVGISKIINLLSDGISKGVITDNTSNVSLLEEMLVSDISDVIRINFMTIDVRTQMFSVAKSTRMMLDSQKEDKYDQVSLKKLNTYFSEYPIMLEEVQPLKDKKSVFER